MPTAPVGRSARLLATDTGRPAWMPLLGGFLGRLGQSYQAVSTDRTALSIALRDAARLLGSDLHVVLPDPTLLAEALGAPVAWMSPDTIPAIAHAPWATQIPSAPPAGVASTGRLGAVLGAYRDLRGMDQHIGIAVALTGPGLLSFQLRGETLAAELEAQVVDAEDVLDVAAQAALEVMRAAGEIGTDLVVVLEAPSLVACAPKVVAEAWRPIANLAAFYDAPVLAIPTPALRHVGTSGGTAGGDEAAADLAATALGDLPGRWVLRWLGEGQPSGSVALDERTTLGPAAIAIPPQLLGADNLVDVLARIASPGDLITTTSPLPVDASAAGLLAVRTWIDSWRGGH